MSQGLKPTTFEPGQFDFSQPLGDLFYDYKLLARSWSSLLWSLVYFRRRFTGPWLKFIIFGTLSMDRCSSLFWVFQSLLFVWLFSSHFLFECQLKKFLFVLSDPFLGCEQSHPDCLYWIFARVSEFTPVVSICSLSLFVRPALCYREFLISRDNELTF